MSTIKIFGDKLLYSPFDFPEFVVKFKKTGVEPVTTAKNANIISSSYMYILDKWIKKFGATKKYLLWTHEPYHDWTYKSQVKRNGVLVHVMNCYTRDVFTHNYRYFYFLDPINWNGHKPSRNVPSIVALSTYYQSEYYKGNKWTTLPLRYKVIEEGYKRGLVDVHGKGWEKHPVVDSVGNSRNDSDRRQSKEDILKQYRFNICLENTCFPHYVTEKIWESIRWGCLPIYYSNSTIYQTFTRTSFIDVKDFIEKAKGNEAEGIKNMYDYLENMTEQEWCERYRECVRVFNYIIESGYNTTGRLNGPNLNINYLEYDTCYEKLVDKIHKIFGKKKVSVKRRTTGP